MTTPKVKQPSFKEDFVRILEDDSTDLDELISNYSQMLECILNDFKFNKIPSRSMDMLTTLELEVDKLFDK